MTRRLQIGSICITGAADFGAGMGTCRSLRFHLAPYSLSDQAAKPPGTRFALFAENSPPGCFLSAQTLSGSSPMQKTGSRFYESRFLVRAWGLEPQRIAAQEPKSCMSANSIMPASVLNFITGRKMCQRQEKPPRRAVFLRFISRRQPAGSRQRWRSR